MPSDLAGAVPAFAFALSMCSYSLTSLSSLFYWLCNLLYVLVTDRSSCFEENGMCETSVQGHVERFVIYSHEWAGGEKRQKAWRLGQ